MKNKAITIALLGALVLGGIAFAAVRMFFGPSDDRASSIVPADAFVYGNVFVRPSNSQKMAIEDILEAAGQSSEDVTESLSDLLDRGLEECDATFEDDVDPWLGDQVAFFFSAPEESNEDPDGAALLESKDDGAAQAFLDKCRDTLDSAVPPTESEGTQFQPLFGPEEPENKTYEDFDYRLYNEELTVGFVEGFLVVGNENGFKATVDTAQADESLAESDEFEDVSGRVTTDNLALFYLNPGPALEAARKLGQADPEDEQALEVLGQAFEKPTSAAFHATSEGFVFESASPWASDGPLSPVLEILEQETGLDELPSDAWFAAGFPDIGRLAGLVYETALELDPRSLEAMEFVAEFENQSGLDFQDHIVDGLGRVRIFLSGGFGPGTGGAVVVETDSGDTASALSDAIRTALEGEGVPTQPLALEGFDQGFTVPMPGLAGAFHVIVDGDRIVGSLGDASVGALQDDETLEDSDVFGAAREVLGDGYEPYVFINLNVVVDAFESFVAPSIPDYPADDVEPILDAISHLTIGAKRDGDYILQRVVIGAEPEE